MKKRLTALLLSVLLSLIFVTGVYADTFTAYGMFIRPPQKMSLYEKKDKSLTYTRRTGKMFEVLAYNLYPYNDSFDVKVQSVARGVRNFGCTNVQSAQVLRFNDGRRAVYSTGYKRTREGYQYVLCIFVQLGTKAILLTDNRLYYRARSNPFTFKRVVKLANTLTTR